jgi:FlaG/FlaF family flagellin (archaellin)
MEMVLVIAIIVLLAAVVGLSVSGLISKSNEGSDSIREKRETLQANNAEKDSRFVAAGY